MSRKIETPFLRTPYNYDRDAASDESGLRCDDPSLAVQDQRDETDINTIVKRFGLTGELPSNLRQPEYGDYTGVSDYQSAMNVVRRAAEDFMQLPAHLRARFDNDPQRYLEFFNDPRNQDEAIALGLAKRAPKETELTVGREVQTPPPKGASSPAKRGAGPSGPSDGPETEAGADAQ